MADRARRKRRRLSRSEPGHDFVIVARPAAGELAEKGGGRAVEEALRSVLAEAGLARSGGEDR